MVEYKTRHRDVSAEVSKFSTSEVWTSKTCETTSKDVNSGTEVGKDSQGFCGCSSQDWGNLILFGL